MADEEIDQSTEAKFYYPNSVNVPRIFLLKQILNLQINAFIAKVKIFLAFFPPTGVASKIPEFRDPPDLTVSTNNVLSIILSHIGGFKLPPTQELWVKKSKFGQQLLLEEETRPYSFREKFPLLYPLFSANFKQRRMSSCTANAAVTIIYGGPPTHG